MGRNILLIGVVALALSLPERVQGAEQGQRWAVLVGIDEYTFLTPLRCAVSDTLRLAATLIESCGFPRDHVFVFTTAWKGSKALTDQSEFPLPAWFPEWLASRVQTPDRVHIEACLRQLVEQVRSGDLFLFYFSGHGAEWQADLGKRHYLALVDANPQEGQKLLGSLPPYLEVDLAAGQLTEALQDEFAEQGIPLPDDAAIAMVKPGELWKVVAGQHTYMVRRQGEALDVFEQGLERTCLEAGELQKWVQKIPTDNVLVILDACRDQARGFGESRSLTDEMARAFSVRLGAGQRFSATLFACEPGGRSYEWPAKGNGFFTYYLLQGLRGEAAEKGSGRVTQRTLEEYLGQQVQQAVERMRETRQQPTLRVQGEVVPGYTFLLTQLLPVRINALPWATVHVDDVKKGQTPLTLYLSAGTHTLRLQPPSSRWREVVKTIEVRPNHANTVAVELPAAPGR